MADAPIVYLDSNVFIDGLEGRDEYAVPAQAIIRLAAEGALRACTSELTLAEVLVRPERDRLPPLKRSYLALLNWDKTISLRPVTRSILIDSAAYRAAAHPRKPGPEQNKRNFLPDAIHVVTAIDAGAAIFIGRDIRIKVPKGIQKLSQSSEGLLALRELLR